MNKMVFYLLIIPLLFLTSCKDDDTGLPVVRTTDVQIEYPTDLTVYTTTAYIGGVLVDNGGQGIAEYGIVMGQTPQATTKVYTVTNIDGTSFSTGIEVDVRYTYYYRAYVITSSDRILYGEIKVIPPRENRPIFPENFDGNTFPPLGWTIIDHDGDGLNWMPSNSSRLTVGAISDSENDINPYNLLITPEFVVTGSNPVFSFDAGSIADPSGSYFYEHFKVVVSTLGNTFEDFDESKPGVTNVFEKTMDASYGRTYVYHEIDFSQFAGQAVYVAIIHYDCTDQYAMVVKNVNFSGASEGSTVTPPEIDGYYRVGSLKDKEVEEVSQGVVLAGGGSDNNDAMKWFLQQANGGDIVVLRASGADGYNSYLYGQLGVAVSSVTTMVVDSREIAEMDEVANIIKSAEGLFIAGGDQWSYVNYWGGTKVSDAIDYLINDKKVVVGGTSAGMAVLGQYVFDAKNGTPTSAEALANPYSSKVSITADFIAAPPVLQNLITDSHYSNRDRHGRHAAYMARIATDEGLTDVKGIACDEGAAVCIDKDRKATVYGSCAYFIKQNGALPETCTSGQPLTWNNNGMALSVYKLTGNTAGSNTFSLDSWTTGNGGTWQWWSVNNGVLTETNQ